VEAGGAAAVAIFARDKTTGAHTQLGCVSSSVGACDDGTALGGARSVAVSPDGKHVYVAAQGADAVVVLARDRATGALVQSGCVNVVGAGGCAAGAGLEGAHGVAISPDGKHVYVASRESDAVVVFRRDKTTGALTHAGCHNDGGTGGCLDGGAALFEATSVTVSGDGAHVYVGSAGSTAGKGDAVALFLRDKKTGLLTADTCVSNNGTGGACALGRALDQVLSVVVTRDGKHVYGAASGSGAVAVFGRD
jgi:DNA-binding beta-propeller fold protein YncE